MDPITLSLLLGLGGSVISGISQAGAANRQEQQRQQRAARYRDIAGSALGAARQTSGLLGTQARDVLSGGEYGTLRQALSRQLAGSQAARQAMAAMGGIGGSGVNAQLAANAQALAQGQYAGQVNQDQLARQQLAGQLRGQGAGLMQNAYGMQLGAEQAIPQAGPTGAQVFGQSFGQGLGTAGQLVGGLQGTQAGQTAWGNTTDWWGNLLGVGQQPQVDPRMAAMASANPWMRTSLGITAAGRQGGY